MFLFKLKGEDSSRLKLFYEFLVFSYLSNEILYSQRELRVELGESKPRLQINRTEIHQDYRLYIRVETAIKVGGAREGQLFGLKI